MYNILNKIKKKISLLIIAVILIISSVILAADGDKLSNNKMTRPKAADVENMTLIYGTHMVYLASLTSELDAIIEKTVEETNQNKIYYKSELVDDNREKSDKNGVWYEVQNAESVDDISQPNTKIVSDDFIDKLQIDYYTPSDGKTYDLTTGYEIDIFNIENIYDISSMEELKSLKLRYDAIKDSDTDDETTEKQIKSLESILKLDVKSEETSKIDSELDYLKKYSDYLNQKADGEVSDEEKSKLSEIRGAKDAQRKALVIDKIISKLEEETKKVSSLADAFGEAETKLMDSKTSLESKKSILEADENTTALKTKQAELIKSLINNAKNNNYKAADENLKDLVALDNMSSNLVVDKDREKALVDELEKKASEEYFDLVNSGESEEYKKAKALNKPQVLLDSFKEQHKNKLKSKSADLMTMNERKLKLLDTIEEKSQKIAEDINKINDYIAHVRAELSEQKSDDLLVPKKDEFKKMSLDSLNLRLSGLEEKAKLITEFENKNNKEFSLSEELESLKEEKLKALDKDDLVKAKEIDSKINRVQKTIDKKQKETEKSVEDLNGQIKTIDKQLGASGLSKSDKVALEKQKATVKSSISKKLNSSSTGKSKVARDITKTATKDAKESLSKTRMKKEDVASLSDSVSKVKNIMSSEPGIAYEAMKEIDDAIKEKESSGDELPDSFSDVAEEVSQEIKEYQDNHKDLEQEFDNSELTEEGLDNDINIFATDKELDELSKSLLALGSMSNLLEEFGPVEDSMSDNDLSEDQKIIKQKMQKLLSSIMSLENNFKNFNIELIDKKIKNLENYAPASVVADFKDMRYIWNQNLVKAWLTKKNIRYGFIQGKESVILSERNKTMENPAIFEPDKDNMTTKLWLPASFLLNEFGVTVQSLNAIDKAIVYDQKSYKIMQEMLESIDR